MIDLPGARRTDPATSHAAAEAAAELALRHHGLVLAALRQGAAGKDAIARSTGLDGVAVARRLPELQRMGLVRLTGRTVASASGRQEREWERA